MLSIQEIIGRLFKQDCCDLVFFLFCSVFLFKSVWLLCGEWIMKSRVNRGGQGGTAEVI